MIVLNHWIILDKNNRIKLSTNLISLSLSYNDTIANEGIKSLINITSLNLNSNYEITNDGIKTLTILLH